MVKPAGPCPPLPGLLPWQVHLIAALLGLVALRCLPSALTSLLIVLALERSLRHPALNPVKLFVSFLLGLAVAHAAFPPGPPPVPQWMQERRTVQVEGRVGEVRTRPGGRLQVVLRDVHVKTDGAVQELGGGMLWTWEKPVGFPGPGQQVRAMLRVKPVHGFANPGGWDSEFHWRRQGVLYRSYSRGFVHGLSITGEPGKLWSLRQKVRSRLLARIPEGQGGALLAALLLGDRSLLQDTTTDLFRRASLAHVLALSGMHLGFVVSLGFGAVWLAGRFRPGLYLRMPRQKLGVLAATPLALCYLWLGQGVPSLGRAALMFFFWGLLLLRGRRRVLVDGLLLAVLVLVAADPLLVYDLGLLLSVTAVAGIGLTWHLLGQRLQRRVPPVRTTILPLRPALALLTVSLAANLVLLPLSARVFGQVSPHILLNLVVLPCVGFVALPLGLAGLVCSVVPGLEPVAGGVLHLGGTALEAVLAGLQQLDSHGLLHVWTVWRPTWPEMIGYWLAGLLLVNCWDRPRRVPGGLLALSLSLLLLPHALALTRDARQDLRLTMFDVGQGQAVLVEKGSRRVLIDGGGFWNRGFDVGRLVLGAPLTMGRPPRLDGVVMTHPDLDHSRGLEYVLSCYDVGFFVTNGRWPKGEDGAILTDIVASRGLIPKTLVRGDRLDLGEGVALEVLWPGRGAEHLNSNDASLVLRLVHGSRPLALLSADAELPAIQGLLAGNATVRAEVLLLPHHGSRSSVSRELYERVSPRLALASAGYLHPFGFPHQEVLQALKEQGVPVYCTSGEGAVSVSWDLSTGGFEVASQRGGRISN